MIVALFDADGTLYSAHYGQGLMAYARANGRRLYSWAYFLSLIPSGLPRMLRLTDSEGFDRAIISRLGWLIQGWSEARALEAFEWVTDEYLLPTRREDVLERLKDHQAQGHLVLIASGTFLPSLQVLGSRLGVSQLVGTGLETKDGRYTGRVAPPIIKGADKLAQIRRRLEAHGKPIEWGASYAYGDSFSDRGFMELTGHPVAVHPEPHLRQLAQERSWEIMDGRPSP